MNKMKLDLRSDDEGTIHVHAATCGDLRQAKFRAMPSKWGTRLVMSQKDIVFNFFPDFEDDPEGWEYELKAVKLYPCCASLPVE